MDRDRYTHTHTHTHTYMYRSRDMYIVLYRAATLCNALQPACVASSAATRCAAQRMKVVVEPSGAVPSAAPPLPHSRAAWKRVPLEYSLSIP